MILHSVYIVRIYSKEENFYKVGVSHDTQKRFTFKTIKAGMTSSLPREYQLEILLNHQLEEEHSLMIEKYLLNFFKKKGLSYEPKHRFGGYTECIKVNPIDYFENFISDVNNEECKKNGLFYLINDMITGYKIKPTDFANRGIFYSPHFKKNAMEKFRTGTSLIREKTNEQKEKIKEENQRKESNRQENKFYVSIIIITLLLFLLFTEILPFLFEVACRMGFALSVC
jgi:hypothetical protein